MAREKRNFMQVLLVNDKEPFCQKTLSTWKQSHKDLCHLDIVEQPNIELSSTLAIYPHTEILICTYGPYNEKILTLLPNLKAIVASTTALEYLPLAFCRSHNIRVYNTKNYTGSAVAEHCLAMIFAIARGFTGKAAIDHSHLSFELSGKTIGIVGFGNIGQKLSQLVAGLNMRSVHFNRSPVQSSCSHGLELDELLATADILAVTLPLNGQSKHLLNSSRLNKLKKGAIVISISPDEVFDFHALETMLASGHLYGLGLDMHSDYPQFFKYPNFIGTKTRAWYTSECITRRTQHFLVIVDDILSASK